MNFWTAIASVFRRYAEFSGRSGRSEFWWFMLFSAVSSVATGALDSSMFPSLTSDPESGFAVRGGPLSAIYTLVTLVPTLAVSARRFHDTGRSGRWILIWLVPVVGWIVAIVICAQPGQPRGNQYGSPVTSAEPAIA